jgi:hypothetical protein
MVSARSRLEACRGIELAVDLIVPVYIFEQAIVTEDGLEGQCHTRPALLFVGRELRPQAVKRRIKRRFLLRRQHLRESVQQLGVPVGLHLLAKDAALRLLQQRFPYRLVLRLGKQGREQPLASVQPAPHDIVATPFLI